MSVRVMAWVFDQAPTTSHTDHLVLLAIADRCNDEGLEAYPSMSTLARKTRLTRRSILTAINRLKSQGLLKVRSGEGKRGTHRYEIRMVAVAPTCEAPSGVKRVHMRTPFTPGCEPASQGVRTPFTPGCEAPSHDPPNTPNTSSTSKEESSASPASPCAEQVVALWNEITEPPIPRCRELDETRRRRASARLRDRGLDGMREVFTRINASPFCRGENDRGWRASFDWALKPGSISKVLEGNYVSGTATRRPSGRTGAPSPGKYDHVMEDSLHERRD